MEITRSVKYLFGACWVSGTVPCTVVTPKKTLAPVGFPFLCDDVNNKKPEEVNCTTCEMVICTRKETKAGRVRGRAEEGRGLSVEWSVKES